MDNKTITDLRRFNTILETAINYKDADSRARIYFPKNNPGSSKVFSSTWPIFEWLYNLFGYANYLDVKQDEAIHAYKQAFDDKYSNWSGRSSLLEKIQENFSRYIQERKVTCENFLIVPY